MNKVIRFFFILNILNFCYQSECGYYSDESCGGYNTQYILKCHRFISSTCQEIQTDDGCYFDSTDKCDKETDATLPEGEICYEVSSKNCRRIKDQCTSFKDTNCGDHSGINDLKQCVKLSGFVYCSLIDIDNYCEVKNDLCSKKTGLTSSDFDDSKDICAFDDDKTSCKKRNKLCSDQVITNCNGFTLTNGKTCSAVTGESVCKEVTISEQCQIVSGICTDGSGIETGKICVYNTDKTTCTTRTKLCSDQVITNCNGFTLTNGKTCSAVTGESVCKEVTISDQCQIASGVCTDGSEIETGKICVYNTDKTTCTPRNKVCSEYSDSSCGNIAETNTLQCFKFYSACQEVELDGFCHVVDGECVEKQTPSNLNDNEICAFNSDKTKCQKREKYCTDITDDTCDNYNPITKLCFKFEGQSSCKEVKVDDSCQMNSSNQCVAKGSLGKNEACVLDDNKERCYKTKTGSASFLNIKSILLLLLFFMC